MTMKCIDHTQDDIDWKWNDTFKVCDKKSGLFLIGQIIKTTLPLPHDEIRATFVPLYDTLNHEDEENTYHYVTDIDPNSLMHKLGFEHAEKVNVKITLKKHSERRP